MTHALSHSAVAGAGSGIAPVSKSRSGRMRHVLQLDALLDSMMAGRFGGAPVNPTAPPLLIALLDQLDWQVDARRFAGAMPHFPERFGELEIRSVLAGLGFKSQERRVTGRLLGQCSPGTLVVDSDGRCLLIESREAGKPVLFAPDNGTGNALVHPITPHQRYRTIQFERREDRRAQNRKQVSWTGETWRRFTPEIRLLFALSLMSGGMVILVSFAISMIFDTVIPAKAFDTLGAILLGVVTVFLADMAFRQVKARIIGRISGRLEFLLASSLFAKLLSLPLDMLTAAPVSDQLNRLRQFETVRDLFGGPFAAVILELPFVLVLWLTIAVISFPLALVLLGLILFFAVLGAFLVPQIKRDSKELASAKSMHARFVMETITNRGQIGRQGLAPIWMDKLATHTDRLASCRRRVSLSTGLLNTLSNTAMPLAAAVLIGLGATMVISETLTGGQLVAVTILTWRLLAPVQQALMLVSKLPEIGGLLKQIDALMRIETESGAGSTLVEREITSGVSMEGVVFRYPNAFAPALIGVTLEVKPGELVVVTGVSGSGKTTLLRNLLGLNKPQSGSIRIGGLNVSQLSRSERAAHLGYVSQTPLLFYGTVAQNLRLSSPLSTQDELWAVLDELGLGSWVRSLPEEMETRLDPDLQGHLITPGVASMLAVAQALLRRPSVLMLDEPASGLDPLHETCLVNALDRRRGRMTTLMVTHRPSHAQRADAVILMNAGTAQVHRAPSQKGPSR